jgi:hypothetical protein
VVTRLDPDGDGRRRRGRLAVEPDKDGDGVPDGYEKILPEISLRADQMATGRPAEFDSDDDGLSDGRELALRTAPLLADTDGDGLEDGERPRAGSVVHVPGPGRDRPRRPIRRVPTATGGAMLDGSTICGADAGEPRSPDTDGDGSPTRLMLTRTA